MKSLLMTSALTGALLTCASAFAQHSHEQHAHELHSGNGHAALSSPQPATPYAGMQNRAIKALSDEQIAQLRAGKGMALALAAELNGYPGPMHALELAPQLGMSAEQQRATQQWSAQMKAETVPLGEQVIAAEDALDRLFRERQASPDAVRQATEKTAQAHAQLRTAHLRYHLLMNDLLTREQIARYDALRGYR